MNIEKIYNLIQDNRKLQEYASYPVMIKDNVIWFNFKLNQSNGQISTTKIFYYNIKEDKVKVSSKEISSNIIDTDDIVDVDSVDDIDDEEYFMSLEDNKNKSIEEILELITKTKDKPFIELYKLVINFCELV